MDQNLIDKIKEANDIADVVGEFVTLKKSGANLVGMCPFHTDRHPSMSVSRRKQMYNCFVCSNKGDVIQFVQEHEHMSFHEAVSYLAKRVNIEYQPTEFTPEQREQHQIIDSLRIASKGAADFYISNLNIASGYLKGRGYDITDAATRNILNLFSVGYAPDGNALKKWCGKAGYSEAKMLDIDVIKKGEHGTYDAFRDRLTFPFFDLHGNVTGFSARIIGSKENAAKYLNTGETMLFTKGKQVFGLFQARESIRRLGYIYLVEGQMDVLSMHLSGVPNTIAGSGTAFTEDQVRLVNRFTSEIVLAYDGDAAGLKASLRNAQSFLRSGFSVRCVQLPAGKDPDNLALELQNETSKWLINNTVDLITYFYNIMVTSSTDIEGNDQSLNTLIELISQIDSKTKRYAYCRNLARLSDNDAEELIKRADNLYKKLPPLPSHAEMEDGIYGLDVLPDVINEGEECVLTNKYEEFLSEYGENPVLYLHGELTNARIQELRRAHNLFSVKSEQLDFNGEESAFMHTLAAAARAGINIMVDVHDVSSDEDEYDEDDDSEDKKKNKKKKPKISSREPFINYYIYLYGMFLCSYRGDKTDFIERCAEMISYCSESSRQVNIDNYKTWLGVNKSALTAIIKPYIEKQKSRVAISAQRQDDLDDEEFGYEPGEVPDYVSNSEEYSQMYKERRYYPRLNKAGEPVCYIFEENNRLTQVGDFFMIPLLHIQSDNDQENKRVIKINRRYYSTPLFIEIPSISTLRKNSIEERLINLEGVNFSNGEEKHWTKIREYMSRRYIGCTEVTTYGNQQQEGSSMREDDQFFAFSNGIFHVVAGHPQFDQVNELGVVTHNKKNYYLPAFSAIYAGSGRRSEKYELVSSLMYRDIPASKQATFEQWTDLMDRVYKINNNGKWAMIFAIMCAFRSNIHCIDRLFTAPFFMGPMSSGKTQVAISIRSLFISPNEPIFNLIQGTDAAMSTMMSTFRDVPIVLDEYNNKEISDYKFQAMKGIVYDGDGRQKRKGVGSREIETDKVLAPVIICGQETPQRDDNALMSRIIVCEVPKPSGPRTQEETEIFDRLKDIENPNKIGLSNVLFEVLQLRPKVMQHFKSLKKECYNDLKNTIANVGEIDRLMKTASLFLATCRLIEEHSSLNLPFTYKEFFQIAMDKIKFQVELISKTDKLATFFKAMDVMIDTKAVIEGRDFSIEEKDKLTIKLAGNEKKEVMLPANTYIMFLRVSSVYTMFARSSYNKEDSTQSTIEQNLRSHPSYIGVVQAKRFKWKEVEEVPNGDFTAATQEGTTSTDNRVTKRSVDKSMNSSCIALNYNIFRELYDIDLERNESNSQPQSGDTNENPKQDLPF